MFHSVSHFNPISHNWWSKQNLKIPILRPNWLDFKEFVLYFAVPLELVPPQKILQILRVPNKPSLRCSHKGPRHLLAFRAASSAVASSSVSVCLSVQLFAHLFHTPAVCLFHFWFVCCIFWLKGRIRRGNCGVGDWRFLMSCLFWHFHYVRILFVAKCVCVFIVCVWLRFLWLPPTSLLAFTWAFVWSQNPLFNYIILNL